jgi:hypothetical protein
VADNGKRTMTDILDELAQAYSFLRDPLLGKAVDEIAEQRRTIEKMRRDLHDLRHEVQILSDVNRDLYMQMEYDKKH